MKLRMKLLLGLSMIWGLFLGLMFLASRLFPLHLYMFHFVLLSIVFAGLTAWLLHHLVIDRLEKLNRDVITMMKDRNLAENDGEDELKTVSIGVDHMRHLLESSHEHFEERVRERTQQLNATNVKLAQEVQERRLIEKNLVFHKEHLARLAHYDCLTGLPNRVLFNGNLNFAIAHAIDHQKKMALLYVDLDRFKNINDAFGHDMGDYLLKEIARRFCTILRSGDILSRFGGDEFLLLLPDVADPSQIGTVATKLLEICAQPIWVDNRNFIVTASIGICVFPEHGTSLEELQKNADIAMYHAKRMGGGILQYFTDAMKAEAHEQAQIEVALRKAIHRGDEFLLYFQPKLDIKTGTLLRAEALIRWDSPELGSISPLKFIPLAENSGLIMAIGEWTLRKACESIKAWQDAGYPFIKIAVNLSPKQFRHQNVPGLVQSILAETGLDPQWLEIEITETAVMDDVETAIETMQALCKLGISIAMDDFGTGYTSISYLKQFPISVLKIDQSFVKELPQSHNDTAIVTGIIALAHRLGMQVVAEGVETAEQLQFLAENDCDIVQGYYLSRPLPEDKFLAQLKTDQTSETAPT